jgi:putative inorganic carbon (HCO3(-)) transporter
MGLILTAISIILCYFSPGDLFPELAPYHIQQIIIAPALLSSCIILSMRRVSLLSPQWMLMLAFWGSILVSELAKRHIRGGAYAMMDTAIMAVMYFLVAVNAYSLPRIRLFSGLIILSVLFMAIRGIVAFHTGMTELLTIHAEDVPRIRGLGIVNDPNDFAQILLLAMALLGFFWRKGNFVRNVAVVLLPAAILMYAVYLTFSRGAMFGLVAIVWVMISRKAGKTGAVVAAGIAFAAMLALNFGGGREISVKEGSAAGRVMAWGAGIQYLKEHPIVGVGYNNFMSEHDMTAHNSAVLCFAELGLFGYFFWLGLIIITVWNLERLLKVPKKEPDDLEIENHAVVLRAALYSFLATAWFLSRTYNFTLYIILALCTVLIQQRKEKWPQLTVLPNAWIPATLALEVMSILVVYVVIRVRTF